MTSEEITAKLRKLKKRQVRKVGDKGPYYLVLPKPYLKGMPYPDMGYRFDDGSALLMVQTSSIGRLNELKQQYPSAVQIRI